jgi:hypothetical protein
MKSSMPFRAVLFLAVVCVTLGGCGRDSMVLMGHVNRGEYDRAVEYCRPKAASTRDPSDRQHILDRMRLFYVRQLDGRTHANEGAMDELFNSLTTTGVNQSKTVQSIVLYEGMKIWKGEPFEQALAFSYIAAHNAMLGSWDNALAASTNSLFHLKDFRPRDAQGRLVQPATMDSKAFVEVATAKHARREDNFLDDPKNYTETPAPYTLGHVLCGIANQQLAREWGDTGRTREMKTSFAKAVACDPSVRPLVERLESKPYNTVLLVDFGRGPQKTATGMDGAIALFKPRTPSNQTPLFVSAAGEIQRFAPVCDLNVMARDHMWNNLEDVRIAKSYLGTALIAGGAATVILSKKSEHRWVGAGMILGGLLMKASARADTRYCQVLPQRVYLAVLNLPPGKDSTVTLSAGRSRLILTNLRPSGKTALLRHVRLFEPGFAPSWSTRTQTLYHSDAGPATASGREKLPYIFGGHCLAPPTAESLAAYQQAGFLKGMTLWQLKKLYRSEGINIEAVPKASGLQTHILEGGTHMNLPLAGSMGFGRILRREHPSYQPKTEAVRCIAQQYQPWRQPAAPAK